LCIEGENPQGIYEALLQTPTTVTPTRSQPINWQFHFSKKAYLDTLQHIQQHIINGDCYELNFCLEAYCNSVDIDPFQTFVRLNTINPAPYACLYRNEDAWLIGASPERFLFKSGDRIYAQPIKGTIGRGKNKAEDDLLRQTLLESIKDRAENIMIVDLMRSDLAKCCVPGSIQASELFGLYAFPQVHQMISTIQGQLLPMAGVADVMRSTFPMGSMTGAPKVMVMQLIEQYERSRRGIYSGTVGYINPDGDFDFNVVIRSLMYNRKTQYLSYQAGGAITYDSIPEQEWKEVRLKARAMESVFAV
jgi:para-aminobenzoate synthetase component 1